MIKQQTDRSRGPRLPSSTSCCRCSTPLDLAVAHRRRRARPTARRLWPPSGQLRGVLAKEGLERIDPIGEAFDPNAHEAVGHVPPTSEREPDDEETGPTVVAR